MGSSVFRFCDCARMNSDMVPLEQNSGSDIETTPPSSRRYLKIGAGVGMILLIAAAVVVSQKTAHHSQDVQQAAAYIGAFQQIALKDAPLRELYGVSDAIDTCIHRASQEVSNSKTLKGINIVCKCAGADASSVSSYADNLKAVTSCKKLDGDSLMSCL